MTSLSSRGARRKRTHAARLSLLAVALLLCSALGVSSARAAPGGPGWQASSLSEPTAFSNGENETCEASGGLCDSYLVEVTNTGALPSSGPVEIVDTLPAGVEFHAFAANEDMESQAELECPPVEAKASPEARQRVTCTDSNPVPPGDVLYIRIQVIVTTNATVTAALNEVEVSGGEAGAVHASGSNEINGPPTQFGLERFEVRPYDTFGGIDSQAGDHPNMFDTTLDYDSVHRSGAGEKVVPVQETKSAILDLPLGLVGDPLATPTTCPEENLRERGPGCPADTQVGTILLVDNEGRYQDSERSGVVTSIYNVTPEGGYPLEFAFVVAEVGEVFLYPRFIPTPSGYALSIATPALPRSQLPPNGVTMMFFGDPPVRDAEELQRARERESGSPVPLEPSTPTALFDNPADCSESGSTSARVELDSWVEPQHWVTEQTPVFAQTPGAALTGCDMLQFDPTVEVAQETSRADTPSGYTVDLRIPQAPDFAPDLATPALKGATVTMPAGVALSPSSANGLVACQEDGPEGINIPTRGWMPTGAQPLDPADPESMTIGVDGLPHIAAGHCPQASQIGSVKIVTPLLANPLEGHIYVGAPRCGGEGQPACSAAAAKDGDMFSLYLEAAGSGLVIKLKGTIEASETGQLTVVFEENPQVPFSELELEFNGGEAHATLTNPQTCAPVTAQATLTAWDGSEANPSWPISTTGCAASEPFAPGFLAQTTTASAGGASPFSVTVSRHDGEQDLAGFELHAPPGLLGLLSEVTPCPEPEAGTGQCPSESAIGHTEVAIGSGPEPVWEPGTVYLTTGYEGAPFGLAIVTPAKVGPYNLGDVVTRAAIHIDPHTAALSIDATRLPQVVDGVPLRLQAINLTIDRAGFMINPTDCAQQQITATVTGALPDESRGTSVAVATPFAVAGCKSLAFAPTLSAHSRARTSKAEGAYLQVSMTSPPGVDNLGKLKVVLPKQLPSRLSTLQKACVASVFEANPANCPSGSVVGMATAKTPVLKGPLAGPAYLVSHGGSGFPDLEIVLQGENVSVTLDGATDISKGETSDAFRALPDAPLTSFKLVLSQGPDALLGANANLCDTTLTMPAALTAQDGAVIKETTKIAVTGCPRKVAKKPRKKRRRKPAHSGGSVASRPASSVPRNGASAK